MIVRIQQASVAALYRLYHTSQSVFGFDDTVPSSKWGSQPGPQNCITLWNFRGSTEGSGELPLFG